MHSLSKAPFVLTYHNIDSGFHIGLNSIHPVNFKQHIKYLSECIKSNKINRRTIIAFDDGYESVFTNAYPVMEKYGLKGLLFPISAYIGKYNDWDVNFYINRTRHLKKYQIRELAHAGWEIGSHGHMHRPYNQMTSQEIKDDIGKSKNILEAISGKEVNSFCPPFGKLCADSLRVIRDLGFRDIYLQLPLKHGSFPKENLLNISYRRSVYSIDKPEALYRKYLNNKRELFKENLIHSCSMATVAVKEIL